MSATAQLFSYRRLMTYVSCQRQYQLRYETKATWPEAPLPEKWQRAVDRGHAFHRAAQRHLLGLQLGEPTDALKGDRQLKLWWERFLEWEPNLPPGRRLPELSLTVPLGRHLLTGRFDLLVLGDESVHIFDWKTERRPRGRDQLADDWQTVIYLALLAEGAGALAGSRERVAPEQIQLTYWFAQDPANSVTFRYSAGAHRDSWSRLEQLVHEITSSESMYLSRPLTDELHTCGRCVYQVLCNRQGAPPASPREWELKEPEPVYNWNSVYA